MAPCLEKFLLTSRTKKLLLVWHQLYSEPRRKKRNRIVRCAEGIRSDSLGIMRFAVCYAAIRGLLQHMQTNLFLKSERENTICF